MDEVSAAAHIKERISPHLNTRFMIIAGQHTISDVSSVFTRIINGEIPARFVWQDEVCVAFLDVRPLNHGHVLVVPRIEVDHWEQLDPSTVSHLMVVAQKVAIAQKACFSPSRVGLMIAGFEVPHVHVHVVPIDTMSHLDFGQADTEPDPADLDTAATALSSLINASR